MSQRRARGAKLPSAAPSGDPRVAIVDACNEVAAFCATVAGRGTIDNYALVRGLVTVAIRQCVTKGLTEEHIASVLAESYTDAHDERLFSHVAHIRPGSGGDA